MLPSDYDKHLTSCLNKSEYVIFSILIKLLQIYRQVKLEKLAAKFPLPILFESRRKKLKRFLESDRLTIEMIWTPIIKKWIEENFKAKEVIYVAIDRTQWSMINILMVSLVVNNRAIPLYFELLDHKGNSDLESQKSILSRVLYFLEKYKIVVLGDREFCSVELARWLNAQKRTYFCLRLRKSTYIELEKETWLSLKELGLMPGMSVFYQGAKVTKTKGFSPVNIAAKWKGNYRGISTKEAWFLITNFNSLEQSIFAYKKRMGIEEMFRDFKQGGYDLEHTKLSGHRLYSLLLLITFSYSQATLIGQAIKTKGIAKYVGRVKEKNRSFRRHSDFYLGLHASDWLLSHQLFSPEFLALMQLSPHKSLNYRQGLKALSLVQSCF